MITGGQGIVFEGNQIDKPQKEAIKLCLFKTEEQMNKHLRKQRKIINSIICHKYIVKTIDQFRIKNSLMIVQIMELCECDLSKEILNKNGQFTLQQIVYMFNQLINSLIEIHTNNIIHFDIKPKNILKTQKNEFKLTDFGISNILHLYETDCKKIFGLTTLYSSPEQLNQFKNKTNKKILITYMSDIFSMGLTFLYILGVDLKKNISLKNSQNQISIAQAIREGYWPKEIQEGIKNEQYLTLLSFVRYYMVNQDPNKRKRAIILKKILMKYYNGKNMELNEERDRKYSLIKELNLKKFKYFKYIVYLNQQDKKIENDPQQNNKKIFINLLIDRFIFKYIKCHQYEAYLLCLIGQIEQNPEENFQKALDKAQRIQDFSKQDYLYFLNEFGIAQLNSLKFEQAKSNLLNCYNQRVQEDLDVDESIYSLSLLYEKMGKLEKALKYDTEALNMRKQKYHPNHPEYAKSLNRCGYSKILLDKFEEGEDDQLQSLELRIQIFTGDHPDIAESYKSIAQSYYKIGEYQNSIDNYELALKMLQSIYGEDNQYTAEIFYNLGIIYGKLVKHKTSLKLFRKCLKIRVSTFKEDHPLVAQTYSNMFKAILVECEFLDDRYFDIILEYYLKAYEIRKKTLPENHPDIAESQNNIGFVYLRKKDFFRSLYFCKKALLMRKCFFPEKHLFIAHSLNSVGFCYGQLKILDQAQKYQFKSLEIRKILFKGDHLEIAQLYREIADVYFINGLHLKSITFNIKCIQMRKRLRKYENFPQNKIIFKQISDSFKILENQIWNLRNLKAKKIEIAQLYREIAQVYFINGIHLKSIMFNIKCIQMRKGLRKQENFPQNQIIFKQISDSLKILENQICNLSDLKEKKTIKYLILLFISNWVQNVQSVNYQINQISL